MAPAARYSHIFVLGRGGMADVYLARSARGELVALKRLRDASQLTTEYRVQLQREADISALMQHPNVVRFRDFGEDSSGPYLALDFVEGITAAALLRGVEAAGAPLELDAAYSLAADVASGVAYAHGLDTGGSGRGVVHRDLSLGNVLLNLDGVARVADFGIARLADQTRLTATGAVRGKLAYMAPELFHGEAATFASDCFALGCTVFEALTGVKPFRGNTDAELMNSLLNGEPARLTALRPRVDAGVADWVQRALSREPSLRPPAAQLAERAAFALQGRKPEGERALAAWVKRLAVPVVTVQSAPVSADEPASAPSGNRFVRRLASSFMLASLAALAASFGIIRWVRAPTPAIPVAVTEPPPPAPAPAPEVAPAPPVAVPETPPEPVPQREAEPTPKKRTVRKAKTAEKLAATEGRLRVDVTPAAVVFVDGRRIGETPLAPFGVPAGEHVVLLVNRGLGVSQSRRVTVQGGETTTLSVSLSAR